MLKRTKIFLSIICLTIYLMPKADCVSPQTESPQPNLPKSQPGFIGELPKDPFELTWGEASAPVTIVAYTALSCGHCAEFHKTIFPEIRKKYIDKGQVRFVFRHFPIDRLSLQISTIVNEVPVVKRASVIDQIFQEQDKWIESEDKAYQKVSYICGISLDKCHQIMKNQQKLDATLQSRLDIEKRVAIEGTPTFFINDKMYPTALSSTEFDQIIAAQLQILSKTS